MSRNISNLSGQDFIVRIPSFMVSLRLPWDTYSDSPLTLLAGVINYLLTTHGDTRAVPSSRLYQQSLGDIIEQPRGILSFSGRRQNTNAEVDYYFFTIAKHFGRRQADFRQETPLLRDIAPNFRHTIYALTRRERAYVNDEMRKLNLRRNLTNQNVRIIMSRLDPSRPPSSASSRRRQSSGTPRGNSLTDILHGGNIVEMLLASSIGSHASPFSTRFVGGDGERSRDRTPSTTGRREFVEEYDEETLISTIREHHREMSTAAIAVSTARPFSLAFDNLLLRGDLEFENQPRTTEDQRPLTAPVPYNPIFYRHIQFLRQLGDDTIASGGIATLDVDRIVDFPPRPAQRNHVRQQQVKKVVNLAAFERLCPIYPVPAETAALINKSIGEKQVPVIASNLTVEDESEIDAGLGMCTICLSVLLRKDLTIDQQNSLRYTPKCKHVFHSPCIKRWLKSNSTSCPVCRMEVVDSPEDYGFLNFNKRGFTRAADVSPSFLHDLASS